jgi:hydroxymethylbilane synthase
MKRTMRIGSRDSALAIIQAQIVIDSVKEKYPSLEFEIVKIKTTLTSGKEMFTKELEQALESGSIDIAIHSYKDMPCEENAELPVVALSKREAPFDVLVLPQGVSKLDNSKPVGSCSQRRTIQFQKLYEGFEIKPIRGNVPTRLSKLDSGQYSALLLAQAGLNRLSLQNRISRIFTIDEMLPSASQGIIAVQGKRGEDYSYLENFHDRESEIVSKAERQFLKTLGGGCSSPVAAFGQLINGELILAGMCVDAGGNIEKRKISGNADKAEEVGKKLADLFLYLPI